MEVGSLYQVGKHYVCSFAPTLSSRTKRSTMKAKNRGNLPFCTVLKSFINLPKTWLPFGASICQKVSPPVAASPASGPCIRNNQRNCRRNGHFFPTRTFFHDILAHACITKFPLISRSPDFGSRLDRSVKRRPWNQFLFLLFLCVNTLLSQNPLLSLGYTWNKSEQEGTKEEGGVRGGGKQRKQMHFVNSDQRGHRFVAKISAGGSPSVVDISEFP